VARRLAKDGFAVIVHYAGKAAPAQALVEEIKAAGGQGIAVQADVANAADVERLFKESMDALGEPDVAESKGLKIDWSDSKATSSRLAVITQTPKQLDFPGSPRPTHFHYAGPLHDDDGRQQVSFPWERLTGEPLIYASLGSLVNGQPQIYGTILAAARRLKGVQVVLSVGRNISWGDLGTVPTNTVVVETTPQIELLKRAALCITHAGLNTVLEALAQGVPMVALPIGYDQPGVAARIAHHGVGEFMEIENLTAGGLSGLIETVLREPAYRGRCEYFRTLIAETRGLDVAADVIERVFGLA
jgi:MGT family glycosyltransferase